jgi:hypothetical protein
MVKREAKDVPAAEERRPVKTVESASISIKEADDASALNGPASVKRQQPTEETDLQEAKPDAAVEMVQHPESLPAQLPAAEVTRAALPTPAAPAEDPHSAAAESELISISCADRVKQQNAEAAPAPLEVPPQDQVWQISPCPPVQYFCLLWHLPEVKVDKVLLFLLNTLRRKPSR